MMMKLIWNPPVWYDLSRDDTLHTCMPEPKQKEFPTIINLSWASPFFACPLFFFGRCHNLAIMLSWNDPFLLDFLIVDDSIVVGNGFIMLWLMPAKRERERRSNKKCTSAENEIFQMHFLWDFFGVCRNSFFSPLYKWFCKWSIYTVCNPFRLPVLINYIKNSKVQKRGCKLAFSSFQKILFMKRFFSHAT